MIHLSEVVQTIKLQKQNNCAVRVEIETTSVDDAKLIR